MYSSGDAKPHKQDPRLIVGLDLGDWSSFYCVLDATGDVLLEQKVNSTPERDMPKASIRPVLALNFVAKRCFAAGPLRGRPKCRTYAFLSIWFPI